MVKNPLSSRDLELLSSYLDRQLSSQEQRRLEERLKLNPALQSALDELRRTRVILRSLPKVRAPRNFTLTPAMIPARRRQPYFGLSFNWATVSALATFFLVTFFAGDFLGLFSPTGVMQTAQRPNEALALETAMSRIDQQSKAAEVTQEPGFNLPLPPENARGMGGGGGEGPSEATLQAAPAAQLTPPASADKLIVIVTPTPTIAVAQPLMGIAAAGAITSTMTAESAPQAEIAMAPATDQAGVSAQSQPEEPSPTRVLFTPWWVRIVETALLLVAIGAGVFAFTRRAR